MAIKDYRLLVSGLMGNIYLSRISKTQNNLMIGDRRLVPENEFINAVIEWGKSRLPDGSFDLEIREGAKLIATIHFEP
jgi:hypothetical protein